MTDTAEFGDVSICIFPFTSGQATKARPVLVLLDLGVDCLVCRITSVPHRGLLDVSLHDWREAGLDRPSTVRLSRLVTIEKSLLHRRLGTLTPTDAGSVRDRWNEKFRL